MTDQRLRYRAVFVSDFHLGAAGCKAESIRQFLHAVESPKLYLVGDIIDFWVAHKKGKWTQEHTNVLRTLLGKAKHGTQVFVTPGNHDAELRKLNGSDFGNIFFDHQFIHETLDGRKLLIVHGDLFDKSVTTFRFLAVIGAWIYEFLTGLNRIINRFRGKTSDEPTLFSAGIKKRVKRWIASGSGYPGRLTAEAQSLNFDGVVCGHVHNPAMVVTSEGTLYLNAGDWVEHCSAIVEELDGTIKLVFWSDLRQQFEAMTAPLATSGAAKKSR